MYFKNMFSTLVPGLTATMLALLVSGCAGPPAAPVAATERNAPEPSAASLPPSAPPVSAISPTATNTSPSVAATPAIASSVETKSSATPAPTKVATSPAKSAAAPPKAATAPTPTAAATTQTAKAAPATAAKSAPPASPLDMKSLETRLKQTEAIGVFTKIALKNQVDDLIAQFRAFYAGRLNTTLAALRRPYEMLLQKVLALLQDADPPLASAIVASREAIWGILADPAKFATI